MLHAQPHVDGMRQQSSAGLFLSLGGLVKAANRKFPEDLQEQTSSLWVFYLIKPSSPGSLSPGVSSAAQ